MSTKTSANLKKKRSEASFSLIETVVALSILATLIIQVASVNGNAIIFSDYGRQSTTAAWLAKRVMARVEYLWNQTPFKEMDQKIASTPFDDFKDYEYTVTIQEWKFPFVQILKNALGGGPDAEDDEDSKPADAGGLEQMLESVVKQVFGDEPQFMTAKVEVFWAEGAQRNSTSLVYLLTNQAKLDEAILQLKAVYDKVNRPNTPGQGGQGQQPGGAGGGTSGKPGPTNQVPGESNEL